MLVALAATALSFAAVPAFSLRRHRPSCPRQPSRVPSTLHTPNFRGLKEGANADYIPALAKVDPKLFGICARDSLTARLHRGRHHHRGLDPVDLEGVHDGARVPGRTVETAVRDNFGVDATGQRFNSIVAIEQYMGPEINPLVQPRRDHRDQHGPGQ